MREKGFTLLEIALALAVGAVILSGGVFSLYQVLVTTGHGANRAVALTDINQAAYAIKNDLLMAQMTDLTGSPQNSVSMSWIDYTSSFGSSFQTARSANYSLSSRQLWRTYYDGETTVNSIVARNITSLSLTQDDKAVTVNISSNNSTSPTRSESIRFTVHLRSEEVQ